MSSDFSLVKKMIQDVNNHLEASTVQTIAESEKIQDLLTAPATREDTYAFFTTLIEQRAAEFETAFTFNVMRVAEHPMSMASVHGVRLVTAAPCGVEPTLLNAEIAISALFGEVLLSALKKRIMAMPWPENVGPPVAERPALIEQAQKKLAELNAQRNALRQQAADAGITI